MTPLQAITPSVTDVTGQTSEDKMKYAKVSLLISLVSTMISTPVLAAKVGDVDRAIGKPGTYRLATGETSGVIIDLPDGLRDLSRVKGGYTLRFNEKRISPDQVKTWADAFCANLNLTSSVEIADGSGLRNRLALISCN
jgi:hypothetical protein